MTDRNFPTAISIIYTIILLVPFVASSAVFEVGTLAEMRSALDSSATNGEIDTIAIEAGTYSLDSTLSFWSNEDYALTIVGDSTDSVVFDGGDTVQALNIVSVADEGHIALSHITVQNCSSGYGGGVYLETNTSTIRVEHCSFIGNTASQVGGGLNAYSNYGDFEVAHCNFMNNSSVRAGGLFLQSEAGSYVTLTHSDFQSNTAEVDGGANMLYPLGPGVTMTVLNNIFTGNESGEFGGGCWVRMPAGNSTVEYRNNEFYGNSSTSAGDAGGTYIEMQSGQLDYSNNVYYQNTTVWNGGGAWIYCVSGTLSMHDNFYLQNGADNNGGGISVGMDEGLLIFARNILDSNYADNVGGGASVASIGAAIDVSHNTFYCNSAPDGAALSTYFDTATASADVYNNIFWMNGLSPISSSGAIELDVVYSDIQGGSGETWFGEGCIDEDPLFEAPGDRDFQITWDSFPVDDAMKSPCIDSGDPTSPNDPDDTRADMGALYFDQGTAIASKRELPDDFAISAYPNPFNSAVTIALDCHSREIGNPEIEIFDVNGRKVADAELVEAGAVGDCKSHYLTGSGLAFIWQPDENIATGVYLVCARFDPSTSSGHLSAQRPDGGAFITKRIVYLK